MTRPATEGHVPDRAGAIRRRAMCLSMSLVLAMAGILLAPAVVVRPVALALSTGAIAVGVMALHATQRCGEERTSGRIAVAMGAGGILFAVLVSAFGDVSAPDRVALRPRPEVLESPTGAGRLPTSPESGADESVEHGVDEFEAGTYSVGHDIIPGRYRTEGGPGCGWTGYSLSGEVLTGIDATGPAESPTFMVVSPAAESVELTGTCIWVQG